MNSISVICPDMDIGQHNAWLAHDFLALEDLKCRIQLDDEWTDETNVPCSCDDSEPGVCMFCGTEY